MVRKNFEVLKDGSSSPKLPINKKSAQQNEDEKRKAAEEEERRKEEEKRRQEEEKQRKIDSQKSKERENINSALNLAEDGFDEVTSKLSLVYNILSEDILLDNVGFRAEEIQNIKNQINLMNK